MKIKYGIGLILALVVAVSMSCGKKAPDVSMSGILTFVTGEVTVNGAQANIGQPLNKTDEIKTGDKSIAVIQFGQTALITIKSGSKVKIDNVLSDKGMDQIELSQSEGASFSKIVKKGTDYKIKAPTAIAAVRGTSFEFTSSEKSAKVYLLSGNVKVAQVVDGKVDMDKAVTIEAGQTIEASAQKITAPEKITAAEKDKLEQFDKITLVPDVDKVVMQAPKANIESKDLKEIEKTTSIVVPENLVTVIIKIEEKEQAGREEVMMPMTIDDLSKKYGQLTVVKLKDGKQYIGAFSQKGARMEIITLGGTITLDPSKVEKISRFKQ